MVRKKTSHSVINCLLQSCRKNFCPVYGTRSEKEDEQKVETDEKDDGPQEGICDIFNLRRAYSNRSVLELNYIINEQNQQMKM